MLGSIKDGPILNTTVLVVSAIMSLFYYILLSHSVEEDVHT